MEPLAMRATGLAPAVAAALSACAVGNPAPGAEVFEDAWIEHSEQFGEGKADLFGWVPSPCEALGPLLELGDDGLRAGLVLGAQGQGVVGGVQGLAGFDMVFDLFHQQFTISHYKGGGVALKGLGGGVQGYTGLAFGFERSVTEWSGWFVSSSASIGLPFLKDYLSLNPGIYASGVDEDQNGLIAPGEILAPPDGIYGFNIGVTLGFELLPNPLPVGGSVTEGRWRPYKRAIRHYYDDFRHRKVFFSRLNVRLVDTSGRPCPEAWPDEQGWRNCVIEFGDEDASWLARSRHTAAAICHATGSCALPLSWPLSAAALAVGAARSTGVEPSDLCRG